MTNPLNIFLIAVLGACIGSLLNMVIYRLPRMIKEEHIGGFSLWLPRSHCPQCHSILAWYDNIPLLSWLMLHGHCRYCTQPISWRYPLTELSCTVLYLLLAMLLPSGTVLLAAWLLTAFLLALSLIDIKHLLLPDALTLPLLWLGILLQMFHWLAHLSLQQSVIGAMSGYLVLWLIARGYQRLRRQEALGMGDAKLLAAMGTWLGWQELPLLLLLASAGSIIWILLSYLIFRRSLTQPFPFGPGLAVAGWVLFVHGNLV